MNRTADSIRDSIRTKNDSQVPSNELVSQQLLHQILTYVFALSILGCKLVIIIHTHAHTHISTLL